MEKHEWYMTIELKVPFTDKDEALDFQHYLKKNGCQSRLETSLDIEEQEEYVTTVGEMEAFLNTIEERDQDDSDDWDEKNDAIKSAREWLAMYRENIADFYAKHDVGVAYLRNEIIPGFDEFYAMVQSPNSDDHDDEDGGVYEQMVGKLAHAFGAMASLQNNGCLILDTEHQTVTLTEKKPVEDLIIESIRENIFDMFDSEELKQAGILTSMRTYISNMYSVIAGPEFVMMDADDLIEYIQDTYDRDEYEDEDIYLHIHVCSMLVMIISALIVDHPYTVTELIEKLAETSEMLPISFDVLKDSMDSILADMKKLGLISIKNGIIKPAK